MHVPESTHPIANAGRAIALAGGGMLAIFLGAFGQPAMSAEIYDVVAADKGLTLFAHAIEQAGMADLLKQEGPFILFVTSDQALVNEGSAFLLGNVLLKQSNAARLRDLIAYHIVQAERSMGDDSGDVVFSTMRGLPLHMARMGEARIVNGWAVVTERRETDNGVLYIIDRLLFPESRQSQ